MSCGVVFVSAHLILEMQPQVLGQRIRLNLWIANISLEWGQK